MTIQAPQQTVRSMRQNPETGQADYRGQSPDRCQTPELPFHDRHEAGRLLATHLRPDPATVVLALPRGGVPVALPIAYALGAPLDVLVVRKLGVPGQPELAAGAIAQGGARVLNAEIEAGIDRQALTGIERREGRELVRRERLFRAGRPPLLLAGRRVVLVDDGAATGATMAAAIQAARAQGAARVAVAIPVASPETAHRLQGLADEFLCLATPTPFHAVASWYRHFGQVDDATVVHLLARQSEDPARHAMQEGVIPRSATD